jgi:hypothetical protein
MMGNFNRFMPFMGGGQRRGYQGSPPMAPPPLPLVTPYPTYNMPQRSATPYRPTQPYAQPGASGTTPSKAP